jgi:hypothetical protein
MPPVGFFVLSLNFVLIILAFCLLSLLYNTHKTQTSMPLAEFETRKPSKRPPADPRLRQLDH